jgi:hypothetical protein
MLDLIIGQLVVKKNEVIQLEIEFYIKELSKTMKIFLTQKEVTLIDIRV